MSTSAADYTSSLMLSPYEFGRFMTELNSSDSVPDDLDAIFRRDPVQCAILGHYLFLSQSLNDLERQVERHHAEQHFTFDQLTEAGLLSPQIEPHIRNFRQQETRRYRYHPYTGSTHPSFSR